MVQRNNAVMAAITFYQRTYDSAPTGTFSVPAEVARLLDLKSNVDLEFAVERPDGARKRFTLPMRSGREVYGDPLRGFVGPGEWIMVTVMKPDTTWPE